MKNTFTLKEHADEMRREFLEKHIAILFQTGRMHAPWQCFRQSHDHEPTLICICILSCQFHP